MRLLKSSTKPREYLPTRCTSCGFEGHYRFEYVLQTVGRYEKTCRACYWRGWARDQCARLYKDAPLKSVEHAKIAAEENGYTYRGPLTGPYLENEPHKVKCKRCGVITAERVDDIAWGCTCMKSNKTATGGTSKVSCPKVCQQRIVTLKNTAEDGAKFLQHGSEADSTSSAGWPQA